MMDDNDGKTLDTLGALRAIIMEQDGIPADLADRMVATVGRWWGWEPEKVHRIVRALGGPAVPLAEAVRWLFTTAIVAQTENGGELLFAAALKVAQRRGVAAELIDQLRLHVAVPPTDARH
jgi:hypothetical protein